MGKDLWHFPRLDLAKKVTAMLDMGLSSALTFFAPRRMGKTEFLRKDITPYANKNGWSVHYFSFLDVGLEVSEVYARELLKFAQEVGALKTKGGLLGRIQKIGAEAAGIKAQVELTGRDINKFVSEARPSLQEIINLLGAHGKTMLLMDEVQVLAKNSGNDRFVASLRTALDLNKDKVKVIFTGSSREGLRHMFSSASAPFFHFGQNLDFPELGKDFTDHLSNIFHKATGRKLDKDILWESFQQMDQVPQLVRSLVERLALNPNQTIKVAKSQLLEDLFNDRSFVESWSKLSALEKLLLKQIACDATSLFSERFRQDLSKMLGVSKLKVPNVQSALRSLLRKDLVGKFPDRGGYFIEDPNFKNWLQHQA